MSDTSCGMTSSVSSTRGVERRAVWRAGQCEEQGGVGRTPPHCEYGDNRIACLRHATHAEAGPIIPNIRHSYKKGTPLHATCPPVSKTRHPIYPTLNEVQCGAQQDTTHHSNLVSKTRYQRKKTAKKLVIQNTNALIISIN